MPADDDLILSGGVDPAPAPSFQGSDDDLLAAGAADASPAYAQVPGLIVPIVRRRRFPPSTLATPPDFWEAFVAWFRGDAVLPAAIPGGMLHTTAAPAQVYPYARHSEVEPMEPLASEDWPMQSALSVFAQTAEGGPSGDGESRRLVKLLARRLESPSRPPLAFGVWSESSVVFEAQVDVANLGPGPGGPNVYMATVGVRWHVTAQTLQTSGPW